MGSVNLVVVVESVQSIATHNSHDTLKPFHIPSLVSVGAALGTSHIPISQAILTHTRPIKPQA